MNITPNVRGYLAGMLDLKGNAYTTKAGNMTVYLNGVKDPRMQRDLVSWIGGGTIATNTSEGERRGCTIHCGHPHIDYHRTSVRYAVSGFRAVIVLYTLEPSLFTWAEKFREPYHMATEWKPRPVGLTDDLIADMAQRGWDIP